MNKQNKWLYVGTPLISLGLCLFLLWITLAPLNTQYGQNDTREPISIINRDEILQSISEQATASGNQTSTQISQANTGTSSEESEDEQHTPMAKPNPNPAPKLTDEEVKEISSQIITGINGLAGKANTLTSFKARPRGVGNRVTNPDQQAAIDQVLETLGPDASLDMDQVSRTLRRLDGDLQRLVQDSDAYHTAQAQGDFAGMALALAGELDTVMNIRSPYDELVPNEVQNDSLGMTHVNIQQTFEGVPIYGGEVSIHFNQDGNPYQVSGVYAPSPSKVDTSIERVGAAEALQIARDQIPHAHIDLTDPVVKKIIYWDINRAPVLSWHVELVPDWDEHWNIFVSTNSGQVVHKSNHACSQAAVANAADINGINQQFSVWQEGGTFYAIDTTQQMYDPSSRPPDLNSTKGAIIVRDLDYANINSGAVPAPVATSNSLNTWDPAVVSVMSNFAIVEEYYRSTFNRNSIDDKGMNIVGLIHAVFGDNSDNAFWNGGLGVMIFGDGSSSFKDLPKALDVSAHELTHGVIHHSANLRYENQSGALNEHIADFFGAMVDRDEWLMGDGVTVGKDGLRDMQNPGNPNVLARQPTTFSEFANLPNTEDGDWGGVHVNSGIPNRMTYLLSDGPQGIGREKTEHIIYRALTVYLKPLSNFLDYRNACLDAARDLHGDGSPEMQAVAAAFDGVEISPNQIPDTGGGQSTPGNVGEGEEQLLVLHADLDTQDPVRGRPFYQLVLGTPQGFNLVTDQLVAETRPSISGDGKWGLYINMQNDVYWTDGIEHEQWTSTGNVRSIAMSKNQRFIAFTTTDFDNIIQIIDTTKPENDPNFLRTAVLRFPHTSGDMVPLEFADIMSFNFRGDTLVFDARNSIVNNDQSVTSIWGIYEMRLTDLSVTQLISQVPGELIANPIFTHAYDNLLLADYRIIEGDNAIYGMLSIDLSQGVARLVLDFPGQLGQPTHRGDDRTVLFRIQGNDNLDYLLENRLTQDRQGTEGELEDSIVLTSTESILYYPIGFRDVDNYSQPEADIAVPPSVAFSNTEVNTVAMQEVTIANAGNADLEIYSIRIDGQDASQFAHNANNRKILVGQSMTFNVMFRPDTVGVKQAGIQVQSSDIDESNVVIPISGQGIESTQLPTNTPLIEPTFTPTIPVAPTNTPPVNPTPVLPTATPFIPDGNDSIVFEFDKTSIGENLWSNISPGFADPNVFSAGSVGFNQLPANAFASSADQHGVSMVVNPGQVVFVHAAGTLATEGKPVLIQASIYAENPNATITLGALKGSLTSGTVDGSIGLSTIQSAQSFTGQSRKLVFLYEPDATDTVTPFVQVVSNHNQFPSIVWIDKVEVLKIDPAQSYSGTLFESK